MRRHVHGKFTTSTDDLRWFTYSINNGPHRLHHIVDAKKARRIAGMHMPQKAILMEFHAIKLWKRGGIYRQLHTIFQNGSSTVWKKHDAYQDFNRKLIRWYCNSHRPAYYADRLRYYFFMNSDQRAKRGCRQREEEVIPRWRREELSTCSTAGTKYLRPRNQDDIFAKVRNNDCKGRSLMESRCARPSGYFRKCNNVGLLTDVSLTDPGIRRADNCKSRPCFLL